MRRKAFTMQGHYPNEHLSQPFGLEVNFNRRLMNFLNRWEMKRTTALIVEDEALIALDTEDLLGAEGFETIVATTWEEAMRLAPVDLTVAVVNIKLADDVDGQRVIQSLRERFPNLPAVVVTGFDGASPEADLRGLGWPTIRLRKPAGREALASAIWDVIAQAENGSEPVGGRRKADQPRPKVL